MVDYETTLDGPKPGEIAALITLARSAARLLRAIKEPIIVPGMEMFPPTKPETVKELRRLLETAADRCAVGSVSKLIV